MSTCSRLLIIAALASGCAATAGTPLPSNKPLVSTQPRAIAEEAHAEHHGAGDQALNVFLGGSDEVGDWDGRVFGLDYEYRLSAKWGVGGFAEQVSGLDRSFSAGAQLYWHPVGEWVFVAGPGVEYRGNEWEPIARVGGFYEFELASGWVLSPAVFYDFTTEEDLLIYGINVGYIF